MQWRQLAGGVGGLALWWLLFFAIGTGIGLAWPEYREAARVMFQEASFRLFSVNMLLANLLLFLVAGWLVGAVSTVIAKSRTPALAIAGLLLAYGAVEHYRLLWDQLPHWYNLIVPLVMAGSVWLGSRPAFLPTLSLPGRPGVGAT